MAAVPGSGAAHALESQAIPPALAPASPAPTQTGQLMGITKRPWDSLVDHARMYKQITVLPGGGRGVLLQGHHHALRLRSRIV